MYNIITTNDKIQINCKNKKMDDDLVIEFQGIPSNGEIEEELKPLADYVEDCHATYSGADYYYFADNNIDAYFSYESSSNGYGIWHTNLQTGVSTQLTTSTWDYRFNTFIKTPTHLYVAKWDEGTLFELNGASATRVTTFEFTEYAMTENGYLYLFSSDSYNKGIQLVKPDGTVVKIYDKGYRYQNNSIYYKYEERKNTGEKYAFYTFVVGNGVYANNGTDSIGLYIHEETVTEFDFTLYGEIIENQEKQMYLGTGNGVILLDGANSTKLVSNYMSSLNIKKYERKNGDILITSSSSTSGLVLLRGKTAISLYNTGGNWQNFFEDSKGNVYISSSSSSAKGILKIVDNQAIQILDVGYNWIHFYEDKNNVYVSSSDSSSLGLYLLKENSAIQLITANNNWKYFNVDKENRTYVNATGKSLYLLENETATELAIGTFNKKYIDQKGNEYLYCDENPYTSFTGMVFLDGVDTKQVDTKGGQYTFFEDSKGNTYASSYSTSSSSTQSKGVLYLNGKLTKKIYDGLYNWKYFYEDSRGNVYVSTSNSGNYRQDCGCLNLDGEIVSVAFWCGEFLPPFNTKWIYFFEKGENTYVSTKEKLEDKDIIFKLNGNQQATQMVYLAKKEAKE